MENSVDIDHEAQLHKEQALQEERDRFYEDLMQLQTRLEEENLLTKQRFKEEAEHHQKRLEDQSKRVIKRLLNQHLSAAFTTFFERTAEARHQRETCRKILLRMQNRSLSAAFCRFSQSCEELIRQRQLLSGIVSQWTKRCLVETFALWQDVLANKAEEEFQESMRKARNFMDNESHYGLKYNVIKERYQKCAMWIVNKVFGMKLAHAFNLFYDKVIQSRRIITTCSTCCRLPVMFAQSFACSKSMAALKYKKGSLVLFNSFEYSHTGDGN
jgi:hypothetical protein